MRYPQIFIDTLKSRFSVSEVVGKRVSLKRAGREYQGLCPFHKEKTPSFTVNDEKGFYHCFGCGAHGDAIGFVKEYEGISYRDAIEKLAMEAGMEVPKPTAQEVQREQKRRSLSDVTEAACQWFEEQLQSAAGYAARQYIEERGLKAEIVHKFRIGFAPNDREGLKKALLAKGFDEQQLIDTGMLIKVDGKAPYSRFRERLMFPIRDRHSKVVAFGGRIMPNPSNPDAPKYLNSPETELFSKGSMLYNFDLARRPAFDAGQILVCEGYMDVIALTQAGIGHAVAPLGTAVTPLQIQQLWQVCDAPTICLDGDNAGERAMKRVSELALPFLQPGKTLHFVRLPAGEDPDTLVARHGVQAMHDLVAKAPALAETLWNQVAGGGAKTPDERAGQEHALLKLADQIQDMTVKSHYRSYFKDQFWKTRSNNYSKGKQTKTKTEAKAPVQPLPVSPELQLVKLACLYPQLLRDGFAEEAFAYMAVEDGSIDRLRQQITVLFGEVPDMNREMLHKRLEESGYGSLLKEVIAMHAMSVPPTFMEDHEALQLHQARRMWRQAMNAYHAQNIQQDYAEAEREMAAEMNDASYARFMELKQQLANIEQEREQLYAEELAAQ